MKQNVGEYLKHPLGDFENYCEPLCFELAGKNLEFSMNPGGECTLAFLSEKKAILLRQDTLQLESDYQCLKLKEKLYLVIILSEDSAAGLGAIDLAAGFIAFMLPGEKELGFGMIAPAGREGSVAPVEDAGNMIGDSILWRHSPQGRFIQTFQSIHEFRLSCAGPAGSVSTLNCSARYFQLREDIFLIKTGCITEGEAFMMLADMNAVRAVGLSCISNPSDGVGPQCFSFSAYGSFIPVETDVKAALFLSDERKYKMRIVGKEITNPATCRPIPGGLKQYVQPSSEELAGKELDMRLDGQKPVFIRFLDAGALEWAYQGEKLQQEAYECVKGDDSVYMIICHPHSKEPASCVTLVWDTESRLITAILAWDNRDEEYPRLIMSKPIFGAESRMGEPLPAIRHHFTEDLLGKRIVWHYTANDDVLHICFDKTHFRLGYAAVTLSPNPSEQALANYQRLIRRREKYPYYEEKVYYIKIREGLYLYSVVEYAMCRLLKNQGGGELLVLVSTVRAQYIGRTFGLDAQENAGHDIVGAPGCFLDIPDEVERYPCPIYDV